MPDLPGFSRNVNQDSEARQRRAEEQAQGVSVVLRQNLTEVRNHFRFAFLLKF